MKSEFLKLIFICLVWPVFGQQPIEYRISFDRAVHHEAKIQVTYSDLEPGDLLVRMSRSSPGRYAVHEFAKNVYQVSASDGEGNALAIQRPNPHSWKISDHEGTVVFSYTLFANHGDGTYAQIDESHAHLNAPASFVYAPDLGDRPIEMEIDVREDLNWKVATQLKSLGDNRFFAPHLQYFMDSPIEISDHEVKSFVVKSGEKKATINFVLHQNGEYAGFDEYAGKAEKIVMEQMRIFGELPDFEFDTYTFLACYAPQVDGDGMEHRNSTVLTSTRALSEGGQERNIGTVAHEFFHAWNVERIRPQSLEPFDFSDANMSGELWFAEGFTSYYTNLTLCRTGIMSQEDYASRLSGVLGYVINSPGRKVFNPIEMSQQAPFVDAATSVDEVNRENTFISYYSYGNVLGLAMDLLLRESFPEKNLDGFMRLVWVRFGKEEIPYTLSDLESTLSEYSSAEFAKSFFTKYIYGSELPDFNSLLPNRSFFFPDFSNLEYSISISWPGENCCRNSCTDSSPLVGLPSIERIRSPLLNPASKRPVPHTGLDAMRQFPLSMAMRAPMRGFSGRATEISIPNLGSKELKSGKKKLRLGSDPTFQTELMTDIDETVLNRREAWLNPAKG